MKLAGSTEFLSGFCSKVYEPLNFRKRADVLGLREGFMDDRVGGWMLDYGNDVLDDIVYGTAEGGKVEVVVEDNGKSSGD